MQARWKNFFPKSFSSQKTTMKFRKEYDSMGEVLVPADKYWGAQTERSRQNFPIGVGLESMPQEILSAFGLLKKATAMANLDLRPEKMTDEKCRLICTVCDEITDGKLWEHDSMLML